MNNRLQFNPAFTGALVCALLWFALWLMPFHPAPLPKFRPPVHPPATFRPAAANAFRELRSPALFALPSEYGFSGNFPEDQIRLIVPSLQASESKMLTDSHSDSPENPEHPPVYLPRRPIERHAPDQLTLREAVPPLKRDLPVPGIYPAIPVAQPQKIALFLSPELQTRADEPLQLTVPGTLPASVRIYLSIRPDGTVDQAIFEKPVENQALAGAIRRLRFKPAAGRTDGWLDLRFTPEENPKSETPKYE